MNVGTRRLWLIDAAYMYHAQRSVGINYSFDYAKLRSKLEEGGSIFQAYYLNSTPNPPSDEQDAFHLWLKLAPPAGPKLQVKLYPLKSSRFKCQTCNSESSKYVQKGVDIGIATLALSLIDRYDTLILSTGDGDFRDALVHIRNVKDKRVELVVFKAGVSTDIQSLADNVAWIDDFAQEVKSNRQHAGWTTVASKSVAQNASSIVAGRLETLFTAALKEAVCDDDGWAALSLVGSKLKKTNPEFDHKKFGFKKLYDLAAAQQFLQIELREGGHPYVRLA